MILSYSIVSSIILCSGYIVYRLIMSGERQHSFNRFILLTLYILSLMLPLFTNSIIDFCHFLRVSPSQTIEIGELSSGIIETEEISQFRSFLTEQVPTIIMYVYLAGAIIAFSFYIGSILNILNTVRKGKKIEYDDFTLVLTDKPEVVPYSWRNYIIMSTADYYESGEMIMLHEYGHLRNAHWVDIFISWLVLSLQWYNPASWFMKEELKAVHEYQADENVITSGTNIRLYQILLLKKAAGSQFHLLANSLNHSKLKKRVTMMYKKKSSLKRRLCALILVPAIVAGCAVISIPAMAGILETFNSSASGNNLSDRYEQLLSETQDDNNEAYTKVDVNPEFPGGMPEMMNYLIKTVKYPKEAQDAKAQGTVNVRFIVEKDGSIGKIEILKSVDPSLDKEAIRVVKGMPKWIPAKLNGQSVACWTSLPIRFKL